MFCAPERQVALLRMILMLHRRGQELIQAGAPLAKIRGLPSVPQLMRAKSAFGNDEIEKLAELEKRLGEELDGLAKEFPQKTQ
jgi:V/A-type H+-transporting ATPase subunit A